MADPTRPDLSHKKLAWTHDYIECWEKSRIGLQKLVQERARTFVMKLLIKTRIDIRNLLIDLTSQKPFVTKGTDLEWSHF